MYDSVTPAAIPADAEVVAGYVDGRYAWTDADWARFPQAAHVTIAVFPQNDADVLDVETGDATPADCPGWLSRHQGKKPTLYCSASLVNDVKAECALAGYRLHQDYELWVAHYTYQEHLEPDSVATQWTDKGPNNENVDISLCAAGWPE